MSSALPISTVNAYFLQARHEGVQSHILQFNNILSMLLYIKVYETALRYLTPGMLALDWGCGNGHFSYFLTLQKIQTTGYSFEPFPVFMKHTELFHFKQGIPDEPTKLPFEDSAFDMVFSIGVLEHVHETGGSEIKSLQEIHRILKPGGLFICCHFPNRYQWVEPIGRFIGLAKHFHTCKYTQRDIRQLSKQTSFRIQETARYNFFPRNQLSCFPAWLTRNLAFIYFFEFMDRVFSRLFSRFCTNHYFVACAEK
jgi:SAM-dependent methyltransferase